MKQQPPRQFFEKIVNKNAIEPKIGDPHSNFSCKPWPPPPPFNPCASMGWNTLWKQMKMMRECQTLTYVQKWEKRLKNILKNWFGPYLEKLSIFIKWIKTIITNITYINCLKQKHTLRYNPWLLLLNYKFLLLLKILKWKHELKLTLKGEKLVLSDIPRFFAAKAKND
jgi:hypothetical protein